jgi:hypothetical protein
MSETGDNAVFPRPGHSSDLAEWARGVDAKNHAVLLELRSNVRAKLTELIFGEALAQTPEQQAEANQLMDDLEMCARAQSQPGLSQVFTGEAQNC